MQNRVSYLFCSPDDSIRNVMEIMNNGKMGIAIAVNEEEKLLGIVVDGDIRRAFLQGVDLDHRLEQVLNRAPKTLPPGLSREECLGLMKKKGVMVAPVVDQEGRVLDCLYYFDLVSNGAERRPGAVSGVTLPARETVLVTGGGGYIGSILVRQLLEKGYIVRVLDKLLFGQESIQPLTDHPHFELIHADMLDIQTMSKAAFGCRHVIHLAAIVGDPACALDGNRTIANNYFTVKTLADISKHYQVERFVFASSCSVYGAKGDELLTEESDLNPVSLYAETRLESEKAILELMDEKFSPVVLRLGTVYGLSPRMRFDLVVNLLTALAVRKGEISIFGGQFWRPFVHCEDVARAFSLCLEAPREKVHGMVFNVGNTKENYQILQVAELIREVVPHVAVHNEGEGSDMRNYRVSFDRICEGLGFETRRSLLEGIQEMAACMRENGRYDDYLDSKYSNYKTQGEQLFSV